ncbi:PadR family transcriptional regulator [Peribacillus sp. NPDC097675]|uniref:PadR family transcriptional regulator n=1 Tax=Peribacillus sp. NPDC097675 TaxID=3390618 RepID=UPI003CFD2F78
MDTRSLILLGLLMAQSQHGYQINEFIERNLSTITDMKKPTAYATLDKLSKQGYIEVHTEQEGNRPPRKVYSINEKGKQYFYELLIQNLSSAESVKFNGDIGLMFIDHLPLEKVIPALENKLAENSKLITMLKKTPVHGSGHGVDFAVAHKIAMLEAETEFIQKTVLTLHNQLKELGNKI